MIGREIGTDWETVDVGCGVVVGGSWGEQRNNVVVSRVNYVHGEGLTHTVFQFLNTEGLSERPHVTDVDTYRTGNNTFSCPSISSEDGRNAGFLLRS